ncbi:hypothetical protein CASFOL_028850 [Castilleja foliolosa]|uniref:Uncharacterized protein n=1 Tax=Castilleja foliolosa TaxID=1961234 RepID=A0ABD3CD77_9LAMI
MSFARSETDVISNRAEDGHVYAAYRREWKSPTKEKASNLKSRMAIDKAFGSVLDGGAIGSLSLTEELGNDVDEELPEFYFGSGDIPLDCLRPITFGDGPCWICNGAHDRALCAFQFHCPLDLKVGEDYKVICLCGSDVVNEKCVMGCIELYGQVMEKVPYILELMEENDEITST